MSGFKGVSIVTGTVTETNTLRETVRFILENCRHSDITEIIIGYPADRVTKECLAVIGELESAPCDVPIIAYQQKKERLAYLTEAFDMARGSHIITVDSDMALDLSLIPVMIENAKKEPETIFSASRWLGGNKFYGYNKFKKVLNICAQKFLSVLYSSDLTDFTIPYQIIPTDILQAIEFEETGFPIFLEMVLKPLRLGYKFKELPTDCHSRTEGKSSNSFAQIPQYLRTALHVRFMPKENILKK
ncbi:MAG: glycosyltransferase [Clostridia bacterium]|nr:glycosyltransferase [Clostridia bacterium]